MRVYSSSILNLTENECEIIVVRKGRWKERLICLFKLWISVNFFIRNFDFFFLIYNRFYLSRCYILKEDDN